MDDTEDIDGVAFLDSLSVKSGSVPNFLQMRECPELVFYFFIFSFF